jgi:hypothetical protein
MLPMHRNTKALQNSLLFLCLIILGCKTKPETPPIPLAQMQKVLKDIHMAEAYCSLLPSDSVYKKYNGKNIDSLAIFYKQIFEENHISMTQFDSAINWYNLHPQLLDTVYTQLLPQLDSMKTEQSKNSEVKK